MDKNKMLKSALVLSMMAGNVAAITPVFAEDSTGVADNKNVVSVIEEEEIPAGEEVTEATDKSNANDFLAPLDQAPLALSGMSLHMMEFSPKTNELTGTLYFDNANPGDVIDFNQILAGKRLAPLLKSLEGQEIKRDGTVIGSIKEGILTFNENVMSEEYREALELKEQEAKIVDSMKEILDNGKGYSAKVLREALEKQGFKAEVIDKAMKDVDFNIEVLKAADAHLEGEEKVTAEKMKELLTNAGFTEEEVAHALKEREDKLSAEAEADPEAGGETEETDKPTEGGDVETPPAGDESNEAEKKEAEATGTEADGATEETPKEEATESEEKEPNKTHDAEVKNSVNTTFTLKVSSDLLGGDLKTMKDVADEIGVFDYKDKEGNVARYKLDYGQDLKETEYKVEEDGTEKFTSVLFTETKDEVTPRDAVKEIPKDTDGKGKGKMPQTSGMAAIGGLATLGTLIGGIGGFEAWKRRKNKK